MIVLNQEINSEPLFRRLVSLSKIIICADGAANRLRNFDSSITPDYIIGDFDSISDDTKTFYGNVTQIRIENQDCTDFEKALEFSLTL